MNKLKIIELNKWNSNKVIAHRGAWKGKGLPQNSIVVLKQAVTLGCYGSEFDGQFTKDSIPVVCHDPTFMGKVLAEHTYATLMADRMPNGESLPTLESYLLEGRKQRKTKLILEIKPQMDGWERDRLLTETVVAMVKTLKAGDWIVYISFGYDICQFLVECQKESAVFYLGGDVSPVQLKKDGFAGADYHFSVFQKHPEWIVELRELGLQSHSWTVNGQAEIDELLGLGIDFITTNEPKLVFERSKPRK